jgi:hypothetical protein
MDFDDGFREEDINAANVAEDEYYNGGASAATSPANELMTSLVNVKKQVYAYFLDITERTHEQNINIMLSDYPTFLSKWEKILTTIPINPAPQFETLPASLKSSLEDLRVALDAYMPSDGNFWKDNYDYMVKTLFIKYPYVMTQNI